MKRKWTAAFAILALAASCYAPPGGEKAADGTSRTGKSARAAKAESERGFLDRLFNRPRPKLIVPAGTDLALALETPLSTETARVGDSFSARTVEPIEVEGKLAIPVGTEVRGHVSHAAESGKVKGRAEISLELDRLVTAAGEEVALKADPIYRQARSTVKDDAVKVGVGAGAGAVIGGIVGGKKGAGIGAAAGGGAGAGVVLATKGEEVVLGKGANLTTRLRAGIAVTQPQPK